RRRAVPAGRRRDGGRADPGSDGGGPAPRRAGRGRLPGRPRGGRRARAPALRGAGVRRVCVIGSSNLDFTVPVPHLPRPGETVSGGRLGISPGGKGANQAVAAARLGAEVRFVTLLGADPVGDRLLAALTGAGLPADRILRTETAATGVALIAVDPAGRNQIAVAPGANHELTPERAAAHADVLAWADVVLLQLETPLETVRWALGEARRLGKLTLLNPAPA